MAEDTQNNIYEAPKWSKITENSVSEVWTAPQSLTEGFSAGYSLNSIEYQAHSLHKTCSYTSGLSFCYRLLTQIALDLLLQGPKVG
jgi:hypothetical protein